MSQNATRRTWPSTFTVARSPRRNCSVVDQSQGHRAQEQDARGADQVKVSAGHASDQHVIDFLETLQQHERPAVRKREITREKPAERGAKRQSAESLEPAQIDLSPAVDAVQHFPQGTVGLEQAVALGKTRRGRSGRSVSGYPARRRREGRRAS